MDNQNFKIPVSPSRLTTGNSSGEMCNVSESIARNIMLLIMTKKQENRYDEAYGNDIWNIEFEYAKTTADWESIFAKSLREEILAYEPRIMSPQIQVNIVYVEHSYRTRKINEIKKKAKIIINAKIVETGEHFSFSTEIFLSPMSVD